MVIPYVTRWLNLIGMEDVTTITVDGQGLPGAPADKEKAKARAREVAAAL